MRVRMSSIGIVWIFWGSEYLNKFDGPQKCQLYFLVSLQTSSTQANHQFSSCKQVTNPTIDSGETSFFARVITSLFPENIRLWVKFYFHSFRNWHKRLVFSYHGLYVRVESNVPVVSNNLHCYNTQSKQQVCCYMPNWTTDMVSLAGHCTAFASYISWLHLKTIQLNKLQHKCGLSIQVVTYTGCTVLGHLHCVRQSWHGLISSGF